MGHIRGKGLQVVQRKGIVKGLSANYLKFYFYKHCIYGKQNHIKFPSGATRAKGILELVHSDIFGLVLVQ